MISLRPYLLSIFGRKDGPKRYIIIDMGLIYLFIVIIYVSIEISISINFLKRLVNHFGFGKKMKLSAFGKRILRIKLLRLFLLKLSDLIWLGF